MPSILVFPLPPDSVTAEGRSEALTLGLSVSHGSQLLVPSGTSMLVVARWFLSHVAVPHGRKPYDGPLVTEGDAIACLRWYDYD